MEDLDRLRKKVLDLEIQNDKLLKLFKVIDTDNEKIKGKLDKMLDLRFDIKNTLDKIKDSL